MAISDAGDSVAPIDPTTDDPIDAAEPAAPRRRGSAPGWLVWTMIVLASLIAIGSSMNTWLDRELLDTDNWVEVSDALLEDDHIREALSVYLVDQLFAYVDVSAQLGDRLPDSLQVLAGPIASALREPAIEQVDRLLSTPQVRAVWNEANARAHALLIRILKDETREGVSTADGTVTLDLGSIVEQLGTSLGLPQGVLDRIPDDAGEIVVVQSDQLDAAQDWVSVVEKLSVVLLVVVIVLYVAAVFIASDRRKAVRNVGLALMVSGAILIVARHLAARYLSNNIDTVNDVEAAIHSAALIGTSILNEIAWLGVAIGVLLFLYAVLVGPTRAAIASRRGLAPILSHRLGAWAFAIVVVALIVWITPGSSVQTWIGAVTLLVLLVVGVERLRALVRREHPDTSIRQVGNEIVGWFESDSRPETSPTVNPPDQT